MFIHAIFGTVGYHNKLSLSLDQNIDCAGLSQVHYINLLALGRFGCNFENLIFKLALLIGTFRGSFDKVLKWMNQDLTDDKSTLVQVMAWCHQATSHYLSQCWPRSMSPYGVVRPQWVKFYASCEVSIWTMKTCNSRYSASECWYL